MTKKYSKDEIKKFMEEDPKVRRAIARQSHEMFFRLYLSEYIKHDTAPFQREMFEITENDSIDTAVIVAFRGSAKSTIMSLSYPLWAMLGEQRKKHIVILSQTQNLCTQILSNIRGELESNELLIRDFGPFKELSNQWKSNVLSIKKYGAKISAISCGESIRGIRYKQHRPDLIICDDVEDLTSVKNKESRDKTYDWLTGEVIPIGDKNTKTIIVGNLLHEDGLMVRLKEAIEEDGFSAIYRQYPFFDGNGVPLWKEKFKTKEDIEKERKKVPLEASWQREYLLTIIPDSERVIFRDWIGYYDRFPEDDKDFRYPATGIDLAISKNNTADLTAMVSARIYWYGQNIKIYILPHPINMRINFPETVDKAKEISLSLGKGHPTILFIEEVSYQAALIQELLREGFKAVGVKPQGQDKRQRLTLTTPYIKNKNILFPKKGCEELIDQLVNFGHEKHDDLADAFSILIYSIIKTNVQPRVITGGVL